MNDGGFGDRHGPPNASNSLYGVRLWDSWYKDKVIWFFFSKKNSLNFVPRPQGLNGAVTGNRTLDLLITNEVLYR